ncbi:hypothetical protein V8D89_009593 [Ganoderma adspersum]
MWLLSTDRAELHAFGGPEDVPGGYAILSHVWDQTEHGEQSFEDVQERIARPRRSANPRDHVSAKIRGACVLAESLGYEWLWVDTCCIGRDRLSVALNGMYEYYARSAVCLAYLADVSPRDADPQVEFEAEFRASRWHTRGWTLQELIAPIIVRFVARDWTDLGSKHTLIPLLESVTRVPASVLRDERELDRCSIAQRMSWAAGRQTARMEDRAYSLMGILRIYMSVRYGEGFHAFARLQEKILKRRSDTSLFAWGRRLPWEAFCDAVRAGGHQHQEHYETDLYLLPPSPDDFREANSVVSSASRFCCQLTVHQQLDLDLDLDLDLALGSPEDWGTMTSTYSRTPEGVLCSLPVFATPSFSIGLLLYLDGDDHLGVVLTPCPEQTFSLTPAYHIGWDGTGAGGDENPSRIIRVLNLGRDPNALRFDDEPVVFAWGEVLLGRPLSASLHLLLSRSAPPEPESPFRIELTARMALREHGWEQRWRSELPHTWQDARVVDAVFECVSAAGTRALLAMGECLQKREPPDAPGPRAPAGQLWANVYCVPPGTSESGVLPLHSCPEHHIREWPGLTKVFHAQGEGYALPFTVAFVPAPDDDRGKTVILNAVTFGGHPAAPTPERPWFSPPAVRPSDPGAVRLRAGLLLAFLACALTLLTSAQIPTASSAETRLYRYL